MNKQSGILKDILLGASVGAPIGGGIYLGKSLMDSPSVLTFPETEVELPLIPKTGPVRQPSAVKPTMTTRELLTPKKTQPAAPAKPKKKEREKKSALRVSHLLGGALGLVPGYKGLEYYMDLKRGEELNNLLEERKAELENLMLQEQEFGAGLKKGAAAKVVGIGPGLEALLGTPVSDLGSAISSALIRMTQPSRVAMGGLGVLSAGAGAKRGWEYGAGTDPRRALRKRLKAALTERLATRADEKGVVSRGPMVVKIRGKRVGLTPIKPGASALVDPTSGRDALLSL